VSSLVREPAVAPTVAAAATEHPAAGTRPARGGIGWRRWLLQALSLGGSVLLWHWLATRHVNLGFVSFANLPSPREVLDAASSLVQSPKFLAHLRSSLLRVAAGFAVAALCGIGAGLAIGRLRWAQLLLLPPLELLRPIPAVAWIPLSILLFPSSEASMIFITFIGALFPILLNTIHGVGQVDGRLIAAARSLGTGRLSLFPSVILPAAAPSIVTGLAIGMGTCWFCLVTAEMISGQLGIGYYTWASYTLQNYPDIVVGMLVIGLLGMGSSALIRLLGRLLLPWQATQAKRA